MSTTEFIAKNYYGDTTVEGTKRIDHLLNYPGIYVAGNPELGIILVYLTLSDEGLTLLKSATQQKDFTSAFTRELLKHPGHHVYVFRLVTDERVSLDILKKLRSEIMKKHNSVSFSWHDNNHDNPVILHTYKG